MAVNGVNDAIGVALLAPDRLESVPPAMVGADTLGDDIERLQPLADASGDNSTMRPRSGVGDDVQLFEIQVGKGH